MAFNTGNPLGSTDPRDLSDNAENFDNAVNDTANPTFVDRLGNTRVTLANQLGYNFKGDYAAGIELTSYTDIIRYSGEFYGPSASATLPYTVTATLPDADANLVGRGDAVLRQELALDPADGLGAALVNGATIYVGSVAELETFSLLAGANVYLTEEGRSGEFVVRSGTPPSDPRKGVYITLANGNYAERVVVDNEFYTSWFGVLDDNSTDNATAIDAAKTFIETQVKPASYAKRVRLVFNVTTGGTGRILTSGTHAFGARYDLVMNALVVSTVYSTGAFITIGGPGITDEKADHKIRIAAGYTAAWSNDFLNVGLKIYNQIRSTPYFDTVIGFNVGVYCVSDGQGYSYSNHRINTFYSNRVSVYMTDVGAASDFVTSCTFSIDGNISIFPEVSNAPENATLDRVGFWLNSVGYVTESIEIEGGVIEGLGNVTVGSPSFNSYALYNERAEKIRMVGHRDERNTQDNTGSVYNGRNGATIEYRPVYSDAQDDYGYTIEGAISVGPIGLQMNLEETNPTAASLPCIYDTGQLRTGLIKSSTGADRYRHPWIVQPNAGYVELRIDAGDSEFNGQYLQLKDQAVGFWLDVDGVSRILIVPDQTQDAPFYLSFGAYDSAGTLLARVDNDLRGLFASGSTGATPVTNYQSFYTNRDTLVNGLNLRNQVIGISERTVKLFVELRATSPTVANPAKYCGLSRVKVFALNGIAGLGGPHIDMGNGKVRDSAIPDDPGFNVIGDEVWNQNTTPANSGWWYSADGWLAK